MSVATGQINARLRGTTLWAIRTHRQHRFARRLWRYPFGM